MNASGAGTEVRYEPIGVIRSSWEEPEGTPIQPTGAEAAAGTVELRPEYVDGLKDLEGFSHIILLYHFHRSGDAPLQATPFLDDIPRGVFAMRGPSRPNPIGLSVVRLVRIEGNILHLRDIDIVDGTPLLDIKPYVPAFDAPDSVRTGWLEDNVRRVSEMRADGRFME